MNQRYNIILILIILTILIFKGTFVNILSYLNLITHKQSDIPESEIKLLKENINNLTKDLEYLGDNFSDKKTNYSLTRLSYKESYDSSSFVIYGGKNNNYKVNDILVNNLGLVGFITDVSNDYSKCKFITDTNNISVSINNTYGTLTNYDNNLFEITNISNYDKINLNDPVYTVPNTKIKDKIYIGYVYKIDESYISKKIYVKSNVDFNSITYLHVVSN